MYFDSGTYGAICLLFVYRSQLITRRLLQNEINKLLINIHPDVFEKCVVAIASLSRIK